MERGSGVGNARARLQVLSEMPHFKLVSFERCPYVQRSVTLLREKGVPFDIEYIDLSNKPDWFLALSPLGKVPVLVVDDETVLFESAVINEYLDAVTEGRMLPEDPLERARGRAWIELSSTFFIDVWKMQIAADAESLSEAFAGARERLTKLEEALPEDGPYFYGAELSLVDAATAPGLQRLAWMDALDPSLDAYEGLPRVKRWSDALLARESVKGSLREGTYERFLDWLDARESWVSRARRAA